MNNKQLYSCCFTVEVLGGKAFFTYPKEMARIIGATYMIVHSVKCLTECPTGICYYIFSDTSFFQEKDKYKNNVLQCFEPSDQNRLINFKSKVVNTLETTPTRVDLSIKFWKDHAYHLATDVNAILTVELYGFRD